MFTILDTQTIVSDADSIMVETGKASDQLWEDPGAVIQTLGEKFLEFGLKVVAAFFIYIIGA